MRGGDHRPSNKKDGYLGKNFTLLRKSPTPPKWLTTEGKSLFKELASELINVDRLTKADVNPLAKYCDLMSEYIDLRKAIKDEGQFYEISNGTRIPVPEYKRLNEVTSQMKYYEDRFHFNPESRLKNKLGAVVSSDKIDPAMKFLKKAK